MIPWGAEENMTEVPSLGYQGGAWLRADQGVHTSLWSGKASPGVPGWQNGEPSVTWCPWTRCLSLLQAGPVQTSSAPESGVPGLSFLKVISKFENTALPELALETGALSTDRARLHALSSLQYPPCWNTSYPRKKSPSSAATSSVAAAAHTGDVHEGRKFRWVRLWDTRVDCSAWAEVSVSGWSTHTNGVGIPDIYHIFDTRYLTNHLNPKGFWLKAFKTSSLPCCPNRVKRSQYHPPSRTSW